MKAIGPDEAYEVGSDNNCLKELVDYINSSIASRSFHYNSCNNNKDGIKYFRINIFMYRDKWNDVICDKAVSIFKEAGWDISHGFDYCGHGPFYSIKLRTEKFNPDTIKFTHS